MGPKERLTRPYVELNRKLDALLDSVGYAREEVARLQADLDRARSTLRHVYDDEPANRQRLYALRASEGYELAFSEPEPLVTFITSTYTSYETLRDVALPSILNQTYSNLEVIVVGDSAPPQTREVVAEIGDPRVRYFNRTVRGPYPEDAGRRWYVVSTPPYNHGVSMARGRWIASLSDDDSIRPDHTQRLLEAARENRWEHCYGRQLVHFRDGEEMELGELPPRQGQWGLQAAIYHAGLRFMELELADADYGEPNDWSLCRRMLAAGVQFGMIDDVVVDKHESRRTAAEWRAGRIPEVE